MLCYDFPSPFFKERLGIFDLSKRWMTKNIRHFAGVLESAHASAELIYNLFPTVSPPLTATYRFRVSSCLVVLVHC